MSVARRESTDETTYRVHHRGGFGCGKGNAGTAGQRAAPAGCRRENRRFDGLPGGRRAGRVRLSRLPALVLLGALGLLAAAPEAQGQMTVALSTSRSTVPESVGDIAVTATLTGGRLTADLPVPVNPFSGATASRPADYRNLSGWHPFVTIAAGATEATASIRIINDRDHEPDETIIWGPHSLTLGVLPAGTITITIKDDDPLAYAVSAATAPEGGTARLTITLSGSNQSRAPSTGTAKFTITAGYDSGTGKAAATDVGTVPQTVTFGANATSATFDVPLVLDRLDEDDETFTITVAPASGDGWEADWAPASTGANTATVTITDAETLSFQSTTPSVNEGDAAILTVTRSGSTSGSVAFTVTPSVKSGNTAQAGDFTATAVRGTIADGAASATVSLPTTEDRVDEDAEEFTATITTATVGYIVAAAPATVTIEDDDTAGVTVAGGPLTVSEGGDTATYTVVLESRPVADVTITPMSSDSGTAAVSPASLAFSNSDWQTPKNVTVTGGSVAGSTTADVTISHAAGGTDAKYPTSLSIDTVRVTVQPLLFSMAASASAGEGDTAELEVTLNQAAPAAVQFRVTPTYGSGAGKAAAADLGSIPQTITVSKGSTGATVSIAIARDADEEVAETFSVAISTSAPNWESTGADTATVTIQDTTEEMSVVVALIRVTEGDTATLTVNRTGSTDREVPFSVTLHQRSEAPNRRNEWPIGPRISGVGDFPAATVPGTFAAGASSAMVSLPTVEDDVDEDQKFYSAVVTAAASTGYRSETAHQGESGVALIVVRDDDTAGVALSTASLSFPRYEERTYTVKLTSRPVAHLTITATSGDAAKAPVSPTSITFDAGSPTDWNVPRTFTVAGVGAGSLTIQHTARSDDSKYGGRSIRSVATSVNLPVPTNLRVTPSAHAGRPALTVRYDAPGPPPSSVPRHEIVLHVIEAGGTFPTGYGFFPNFRRLGGFGFRNLGANTVQVTGRASTPLKPNFSYQVRGHLKEVRSGVDIAAVEAHSEAVTATTWDLPDAPTAVTVAAGNGELYLRWTAPADLGGPGAAVTGYAVEYKTSAAADRAATTAGDPTTGWVDNGHSGTSATDTVSSLTNGTAYQVRVRAKNGIDPGGTWSAPASGTPTDSGQRPPTPQSLVARSSFVTLLGGSVTSIEVRWAAPPSGYQVVPQIKLSTVQSWPTPSAQRPAEGVFLESGPYINSIDATSVTYAFLELGKTYDVRAYFLDTAGTADTSDDSVVANSSTPAVQVSLGNVPGKPTGVSTSKRAQGLDVSWTAPASDGGTAITGYKVRWRVKDRSDTQPGDQPGAWNNSDGVDVSGTSHRITGLTNDTAYEVQIRAWNGVLPGSEWSASATGTPEALSRVTLSGGGATVVNENHGVVTVTARLNVPAPVDGVRVTLTAPDQAGQVAVAGVDYRLPASFTILEDQLRATAEIVLLADGADEGRERAVIGASTTPSLDVTGFAFWIADSAGRADLPTSLTLSADGTPAEGGGPVTLTATLNAPAPGGGTEVTLSFSGTASETGAQADYFVDAAISISPGATSATASLATYDDTRADPDETIIINARSANPRLDSNTLTLTITDNDGAPTKLTLSADGTPTEGGDPVTLTATLNSVAPTGGTTVTLTATGTATGADYTLSSNLIEIAEGEAKGTATISVRDDQEEDPGETIVIAARSVQRIGGTGRLDSNTLTLTIADNEGEPTDLTLRADGTPAEGGDPVTLTAALNAVAPAGGTTVTLTATGTATGADYGLSSTTIEIADGETEGTATITIVDDEEEDPDETIVIAARSDSPVLTAIPLELTITDNDGLDVSATSLTLSADGTPAEGGDPVTVTATLDNAALAGGTTVTLEVEGTAAGTGADADYSLSSTTIAIDEGETEGTATITIVDDAVDDDAETIIIDATSDSPALTANTVTLTITDNDGPPTSLTLTVAPAAPAEDAGTVTVTATLNSPALTGGTTVTLRLTGTAAGTGADADYSLSSTTIAIDEGETEGTATITIVDDAVDDDAETIIIDATSDSPALTANTVTFTITDNDATLTGLTLSVGELSFTSGTTAYAVEVANDVESVSVTPTAAAGATVTVNGETVASGAASAAISLQVGETIITIVATPANGAAPLTYTVTITRSALPTELTLSAGTTPAEGGAPVTVTATLDVPAPTDGTTVTLSLSGTAAGTGDEADYTLSSDTIAIAAGETQGTATITIVDDDVDDAGETIVLDAESDTPALTAEPLTLTIEDNDAAFASALTLRVDAAPAEGAGPVTVTAALNGPAPTGGTTVTLTATGTATGAGEGADYTLSSTTIAIAAGETGGTATLTIIDDTADDDGETIILNAASSNPALTAPELTLTIADNDQLPTALTLSVAPTLAPAEGGAAVTVTATLDVAAPAPGTPVTLVATGTATTGVDYTLSPAVLTIAAGETSGAATLSVIDDAEFDPDETIILEAISSGPTLRAPQITLVIRDNDRSTSDGGPQLACKPKPEAPAAGVIASGRSGVAIATAAASGGGRGSTDLEAALSLRENLDGRGQAVVLGCVAVAAADGGVYDRYGVVTGGADFRVDGSGTLSYVGGGENHESTPQREVLLRAGRGAGAALVRVQVAIQDVDDAGVVTLEATTPAGRAPQVGEALTARLVDEDAVEEQLQAAQWQWRRRAPGGSWTAIAGATAAAYTPVTGDVGRVLQAQVTYSDRHGRQQAASTATAAVAMDAAARLLQVGLTGWGRTAAAAAVDVIGRRFTAGAPAAPAVTLNGRALSLPAAGTAGGQGRLLRGVTEALGVRVSGDQVSFAAPTGTGLLSDSAFNVQHGGGGWGLWGAGDLSRFSGDVDGIEYSGGVLAGYLGADYRLAPNALAGLAAAYGSLEVSAKTDAVGDGKLTGWLAHVYPYGYWMPEPWLGLWGIAGAGMGHATLDHSGESQGEVRAWLGAAGQRMELLSGDLSSLAVKADGFVTGLTAGGGLPVVSAHAWRGRLLLEGAVEWRPPDSRLAARLELGARLDGGDAERGLGAEAGAEVSYTHTGLGLGLSGRGRLLLAHEDRGLREWGASALLRWAPQGAAVGPAVSVAPEWGAPVSGVDVRQGAPEAVALRLSYGLVAPAGVVRPYAEVDLTTGSVDYRLGVEGTLEF